MGDDAAEFVWHDPLMVTDEQCVAMADAMNETVQRVFDMTAVVTGIPALRDPLGPGYFTASDAREFWERGVQSGAQIVI